MSPLQSAMDAAESRRELRRMLERDGIRDLRVLDAIEATPREQFVPEAERDLAYMNSALSIAHHQTISQPYIVALMTESLALTGGEKVLEIGTGSGYQTAILSPLCREVVTIERIEALSQQAQRTLDTLGYRNIVFLVGDGTLGCPEFGPYDGILVTAAAPAVPQSLVDQLKPGGRMIVPVGDRIEQELFCVERTDAGYRSQSLSGCRFVKLIGEEGWPVSDADDAQSG